MGPDQGRRLRRRPVRRDELDIYDLRHARFSHQLSAGDLDDAQTAAWGGNTVATMTTTYQGVISAGASAPWNQELELYYDEIVPPEMQRRAVTTVQLTEHLNRMAVLTTAAIRGDAEAMDGLIREAHLALITPVRTVAAVRAASQRPPSPPQAEPETCQLPAQRLALR